MFSGLLKVGAGLAGLSAFVFCSLYYKWLQIGIFSTMSAEHTFISFIVSLILLFLFSTFILVLHYKKDKKNANVAEANGGGIAVNNVGSGNVNINNKV